MSSFCYTPPALLLSWINSNSPCDHILGQASEFYWTGILVYLKYFLLTCALESPFYFFAIKSRKNSDHKAQLKGYVSSVFLCNFATHPIVCFLIPWLLSLVGGTYGQSLTIGEIFAPVVEARGAMFSAAHRGGRTFNVAPVVAEGELYPE